MLIIIYQCNSVHSYLCFNPFQMGIIKVWYFHDRIVWHSCFVAVSFLSNVSLTPRPLYAQKLYGKNVGHHLFAEPCSRFDLYRSVLVSTSYILLLFLFQRIVFTPPVYHPVIDPETGELDVKRAFPQWTWVFVLKFLLSTFCVLLNSCK